MKKLRKVICNLLGIITREEMQRIREYDDFTVRRDTLRDMASQLDQPAPHDEVGLIWDNIDKSFVEYVPNYRSRWFWGFEQN